LFDCALFECALFETLVLLLFTGPAIHMGVTVEAVVGTTQSPGAAVLHQGSVGSLILATLAL